MRSVTGRWDIDIRIMWSVTPMVLLVSFTLSTLYTVPNSA